MTGWTRIPFDLTPGEMFTMEGIYERRTFWQWLTRQPKNLKTLKVVAQSESYTQYEAA